MHVDMVSARQKNNVYITHKRSRWAEFRKYQHYIFLKCRNKSKACSISELINTQHVWLNMCVINSKEICKQNGKCSLAVQGVRSVHWNNYLYIQVLRLEHEMSLFRFICGISAGRGWSRQTVGSSPPSPPSEGEERDRGEDFSITPSQWHRWTFTECGENNAAFTHWCKSRTLIHCEISVLILLICWGCRVRNLWLNPVSAENTQI